MQSMALAYFVEYFFYGVVIAFIGYLFREKHRKFSLAAYILSWFNFLIAIASLIFG